MSHPLPAILLFHADTRVTDQIIGLCNDSGLSARIIPVFSFADACEQLASGCYAVLITSILSEQQFQTLVQYQHPRPVVVVSDQIETADQVMVLLRQGATDVFDARQLATSPIVNEFTACIRRDLERAQLVDENERYREELELSLAELKADQKAALQIQKRMLPPGDAELPGGIHVSYCLTPSLYLSGDFVDFVALNSRYVMFYLADVSGHGASSALVTVLLKNMTNRLVRNFRRGSSFDILSPASVLQRVNTELLETGLGKHLTMFIGLFDLESDTLRYAVGGHHPMPVLLSGADACFLEGRGMPVGLFDEPFFDEKQCKLPSSFNLALFSDGILEMISADSMAQKEARLREGVQRLATVEADRLREALISDADAEAPDDIAVMILARP